MGNYFKQIWFELRHQPMVTVTSVLGTAFSIFLVMAVFITSNVNSVEVSPESNRGRMLIGKYIHVEFGNKGSSSGGMSNSMAKKLYANLDGIEKISFVSSDWDANQDISFGEGECISLPVKNVDNVYWEIFDHKFIAGKPFDKATTDAGLRNAIITESAAKNLIGDVENALGKKIQISHIPYIVQGVIKDSSPLLSESYAKVYLPYQPEKPENLWLDGDGGNTVVYLLKEKGVKDEDIRTQVKRRYETINSTYAKEGKSLVYHETPFTNEAAQSGIGSNTTPDLESPRRSRIAVYLILLLLPAINLSSMTRSRLRRRVSEIGVRRAFGATKLNIMGRFLGENLVMTFVGGIIGLVFCVLFVFFFSNLFVSYGGLFGKGEILDSTPTFAMLMNFQTFGIALLFCLLLNLLSTGLPAWRASKVNPAEAISGKND